MSLKKRKKKISIILTSFDFNECEHYMVVYNCTLKDRLTMDKQTHTYKKELIITFIQESDFKMENSLKLTHSK